MNAWDEMRARLMGRMVGRGVLKERPLKADSRGGSRIRRRKLAQPPFFSGAASGWIPRRQLRYLMDDGKSTSRRVLQPDGEYLAPIVPGPMGDVKRRDVSVVLNQTRGKRGWETC